MKRFARLDALGIVVPLRKNEYFFDDGFVKDVGEKSLELQRQYESIETNDNEEGEFFGGVCYDFDVKQSDGSTAKHYHIFYRELNYQPGNILLKAHEESHLLSKLKRLEYLLLKPSFVFSRYFLPSLKCLAERNQEGFANIVAMYAVKKHRL
jgi:hypothetical protein